MNKALINFLSEGKWEKIFSPAATISGEQLLAENKVNPSIVLSYTAPDLLIRGYVAGDKPGMLFSAQFNLSENVAEKSVNVQSTCSCLARGFCAHRYGVLHVASEQVRNQAMSDELKLSKPAVAWIDAFHKLITKSKAAPKRKQNTKKNFLAYTLWAEPRDGYVIVPRVATFSEDGSILLGMNQPDLFVQRPGRVIQAEDLEFLRMLHHLPRAQNAGYWEWEGFVPRGPWSGKLLADLLEEERLFLLSDDLDYAFPLQLGPACVLVPTWLQDVHGRMKPVLEAGNTHWKIILSDPAWCLDLENRRMHPSESNYSTKVLSHWAKGPAIQPEELLGASQLLQKISGTLPKPISSDIVHVTPSEVTPVLKLRRVTSADGVILDFPAGGAVLGILSFHYDGGHVFDPLEHGEDPVVLQRDDTTLTQIHRLQAMEMEECLAMQRAGLFLLRDKIGPARLGPRFQGAVFPYAGSMHDPLAWLSWKLTPGYQDLLARGWIFEEAPDVAVEMVSTDEDFLALEEDVKEGIDWFAFDLGVHIDGIRVSLIPALAQALEEQGEKLLSLTPTEEEFTAIPLDDQCRRYLKFPKRRFIEMAKHVFELFGGVPKGPLKLHRIVAASVADAAGERLLRAETETLLALRRLGGVLSDFQGIAPVEPPADFQATLRPYQTEGFRWLQFLARHGLHGILADDMGLGKTVQTLAHIAADITNGQSEGLPSLVIAPKSVVPNWAAEAKRFAPHLRLLVLHGSERGKFFENIPDAHLVITSYATIQRDIAVLASQRFHIIVLDEAQYIKNPVTKAAQTTRELEGRHRIALSGTPIENHLGELWSLMRFLMPGVLGSQEDFRKNFRTPIEKHRDQSRQNILNRRLKPLILRRTKDLVANDLPEKTEITHRIELNNAQADLYETVRVAMDEKVRKAIAGAGLAKSHLVFLEALLKLRQICCDPALLKTKISADAPSAKLDFLMDLLETLREEGRRILLFSQFTEMLERIETRLHAAKFPYLKLTGKTQNRWELVDEFQRGQTPLFLISLKAGGTGLNLTAADTVIHYDPWWNPSVETQASDRAHRIGQKKPVFVHRLICSGTIEEKIQELQKKKSDLMDALFAENKTKFTLDRDTLETLLAPLVLPED